MPIITAKITDEFNQPLQDAHIFVEELPEFVGTATAIKKEGCGLLCVLLITAGVFTAYQLFNEKKAAPKKLKI
jgi:hypothetical protein